MPENRIPMNIIQDAKSGKRLMNVVFVLLIAVFIFASFTVLMGLVLPLLFYKWTVGIIAEKDYGFYSFALQLFGFVYMSLLVFAVVRLIEGRKFSTLGFHRPHWLSGTLKGGLMGFGMMGAIVLILVLLGCISWQTPPSQPVGFQAAGPLAVLLLGFIVQASAEEILSRGWILNVLSAKYNRVVGIILSSAFFVACHSLNAGMSLMAYLNASLFAVFLALYVQRTNQLWGACAFHALWNFSLGNVFGFDVSGVPMTYGTVIDLNVQGSVLLTGGQFGLEAGLPATFVLLVGIVLVVFLRRPAQPAST